MAAAQDERIRSLAALARAVSRSAPLLDVLEIAAEGTLAAIGAASVSVSQLDHETRCERTLVNVGQLGPTEERWPTDEVYRIDEFTSLPQFADARLSWLIDVNDPDADPREVALLHELEKGSAAGAPLMVDDEVWGEIYATRLVGDGPYGEDDLGYLEALATIVSGAISRARREETLAQLAFHDPLTGLLNRRALDAHADQLFAVEPGASIPITAIVVDINGLKRVNDTYGHQAGDQLIRSVAETLRQQFSQFPTALLARVGGDEFTVLVACHASNSVHEATRGLSEITWDVKARAEVSCGAASTVLTSESTLKPSALFAAADRAQYVAKRGGLRKVVVADDLEVRGSDEVGQDRADEPVGAES